MRLVTTLLTAGFALGAVDVAHAADPHPFRPDHAGARPAEIAFANLGGIDDWKSAKDGSLLIQARGDHYYRATFFGWCPELPFATRLGFVTDVDGALDRWSSVYVDGDRCWFRNIEEVGKAQFEAG